MFIILFFQVELHIDEAEQENDSFSQSSQLEEDNDESLMETSTPVPEEEGDIGEELHSSTARGDDAEGGQICGEKAPHMQRHVEACHPALTDGETVDSEPDHTFAHR